MNTDNRSGFDQSLEGLVYQGRLAKLLSSFRAATRLALFFAVTFPSMLLQYTFLKLNLRRARTFPWSYHKLVCKILGIRVRTEGHVETGGPLLLVSNHVSWLDIPVLSTIAPLSFVAKAEVGTWPFVNLLAKLQRTVFVDRSRRTLVRDKAGEIAERLAEGDTIVLFAEGTSSDGNRVLPFRSSLFSVASMSLEPPNGNLPSAVLQTVAIVYTHLHGLPLLRHDRPFVAWYGDMDMLSHAWNVLKRGPLDVTIRLGEPVRLEAMHDRKHLAASSEARVRRDYIDEVTSRPRAA